MARVPPGPLFLEAGVVCGLADTPRRAGRLWGSRGGGAWLGLFPGRKLPVPSVPNASSPPGSLAGARTSPGLT